MRLRTFDEVLESDLGSDLRDPEFAVGYLQAALDEAEQGEDIGVFLLALRDVVRAQGTVAEVAEQVGRTRASFYKSLSESGNPQFATVLHILPALGMKLQVVARKTELPV